MFGGRQRLTQPDSINIDINLQDQSVEQIISSLSMITYYMSGKDLEDTWNILETQNELNSCQLTPIEQL